MKEESLIAQNFNEKVGGWLSIPAYRGIKLERDIVMLDWVLNKHPRVRPIDEIIQEHL